VTRSPTPAWDDDPVVAAWPGLSPLAGDRAVDACVVGLGVSGLTAVEALVERGLIVVGVDAGRVAAGAAGRNGGFLLGGGAPFLHRAIEQWGADAAVGLYRATLAELDRCATQAPDVVRRVGSLRLVGLPGPPEDDADAADRSAEQADCVAHAAALREHGVAVEWYDGPLGHGLFLPDDAATNPARRALELARSVAGRATLHEHTPVTDLHAGRVVTPRGTISAAVVVVAVDGGLELVLPELRGWVRTARLQMLATGPVPAGRVPGPVYGRWGYDYAQQDAAGRLYVGGGRDRFAEQEWTPEATPTRPVQTWIERVAARLAGRPVEVQRRWAASVGFTPDGRPFCGRVRPSVVACGGYNGTGNLVGPLAARAAVALAVDGSTPPAYLADGSAAGSGAGPRPPAEVRNRAGSEQWPGDRRSVDPARG
jgi:gamma-glutamylputrescine oxidase